ncbi:hypothetical protein LRY60_00540 [Candidatus Woesebacteria bacterium]|nr:hypothetical protein [Candidatus Woesebacteria bacterium]
MAGNHSLIYLCPETYLGYQFLKKKTKILLVKYGDLFIDTPLIRECQKQRIRREYQKVPFTVSYVFPHKIGRFLQGQIIKKPGMMEKLSTLVVAQMARELDQDSGEKQFTFEDRGAERTSLLHSIIRDFGPSAAQHPWGLLHFSREQAPVDEDVR